MGKKKEKVKKKGFVNLVTGQVEPFLTTSEEDQEKAFHDLIRQLTTDRETAKSILDGAEKREYYRRMLFEGNDADVPDDVFLDAVQFFGYQILFLPCAMQKMARWQREKRDPNKDISLKAKDNLIKIGTSSAETGHERDNPPPGLIAIACKLYYDEIHAKRIGEMRGHASAKTALREIMSDALYDFLKPTPEAIERIISDFVLTKNEKLIADLIVAHLFGLQPSVVRKYCKAAKITDSAYRIS